MRTLRILRITLSRLHHQSTRFSIRDLTRIRTIGTVQSTNLHELIAKNKLYEIKSLLHGLDKNEVRAILNTGRDSIGSPLITLMMIIMAEIASDSDFDVSQYKDVVCYLLAKTNEDGQKLISYLEIKGRHLDVDVQNIIDLVNECTEVSNKQCAALREENVPHEDPEASYEAEAALSGENADLTIEPNIH